MGQVVVTGLIGLATVGTTVYLLKANRQKIHAEESQILTATALTLIQPLQEQLESTQLKLVGTEAELQLQKSLRMDLEARVAKAEARVTKLENWIDDNTNVNAIDINGVH